MEIIKEEKILAAPFGRIQGGSVQSSERACTEIWEAG
jgi:hypothetical protein